MNTTLLKLGERTSDSLMAPCLVECGIKTRRL